MPPRRLRVLTLGCSKNSVDTEHLLAQLPADAYTVVDADEPVDVLLVNTCGFIGDAKEESVNAILEAVQAKKQGRVGELVVFGCLSQRYGAELPAEIPEVDAWFGARDLAPLLRHLGVEPGPFVTRRLSGPSGYAYLKISEGCDRRCSYCAIPFIRGPHRSVPMEDLVAEAQQLAAGGVRELILIAQDTTYYGLDLYHRRALAELLERLSAVPGIEWIRIHYSYPADFPEDVLAAMADNPKVCRYLDIPLQHISDGVLDRMHRHVDGAWTRRLIARLRSEVPGVALRTTMIVGHPGETEEEFEELLDFVREARFERLGAFMYSEEEGTYGAEHFADDVPEEVKRQRLDRLMELQREISLSCNQARVGTETTVLVDGFLPDDAAAPASRTAVARSEFESPEVDGEILVSGVGPQVRVGDFLCVRITRADDYDLFAEVVDDRLLDLDSIVAEKFKGKKLPGWVLRFFKRFIHQDWLNSLLARGYDGAEFCEDVLKQMDIKIEVEGLEKVPADGTRYTFASNHPLGAVDGVALCAVISRHFGSVKMPVNDFLLYVKPLAPLCVPINKVGGQARNLPRLLDEAFRSGDQLMIFPAGVCSRKIDGKVQDFPWTKTFITKSVETGRPVVPVHFVARNPARFYRADWFFRKLLKLKFNIPMLFLPDALYHSQHKTFRIVFGEPIPAQTFDATRSPKQWAKQVRDTVYQL